jgi:hypothetical protein
MKTILVSAIITLLLASNAANKLTGRWESQPSSKGNVTGVVFKEDSSFEGYINKKPFVTGTYSYSQEDSTLRFTDNGCNGATGIYKVNFFNNADSLRFAAITDTCTERRQGMQRLIMGRVK